MAKILLVEDDNNLREIYEARLQAEGYTIVSARDGEEALVVAKQEQPDLVISDVMMPKISGFEMLDILRNTDGLKDVKVIMLTALGQTDDQQRASSLGADRYLVKSQVTLEDIVKVAHELLQDGVAIPATSDAPVSAAEPAVSAPVTATTASSPAPVPEPAAATIPSPSAPPLVAAVPEPTVTADNTTGEAATTPVEPLIAPAADPVATEAEAENDAESASQEEAEVEAKIEDFVANAPASTPVTEPSANVEPAPAPEPTAIAVEAPAPATESASATDDKLMASAVENLSPGSASTAVPPVAPPTEDSQDIDNAPEGDDVSGTTIAHKKVIEPLNSEPKEDINQLLAKEQAKEILASAPAVETITAQPSAAPLPAVAPAPEPAPTQVTDVAAPAAPAAASINITEPPADPNKPDPNSIAL